MRGYATNDRRPVVTTERCRAELRVRGSRSKAARAFARTPFYGDRGLCSPMRHVTVRLSGDLEPPTSRIRRAHYRADRGPGYTRLSFYTIIKIKIVSRVSR